MSRRPAPRAALTLALAFLALAPASCIFSPDKDTGCTTNCGGDTGPAKSETELIQALSESYQNRNIQDFTNLFPTDEEAEYLFLLNEPDPDDGSTSWGRTVELRVHQRMFDPEETPVGQDPVPAELWLTDVSINLTLSTSWEERTDLYQGNGGQLDPARWRATDAEYHAVLFFGTQGETDYTVDGRANFVVISDLSKAVGDNRKFLIYRWEDLGDWSKPTAAAAVPAL